MKEYRIRLFYIPGWQYAEFENKNDVLKAVLAKMPPDATQFHLSPCPDCGASRPIQRPGTDRYYDQLGYAIQSSEFEPLDEAALIPDYLLDLNDDADPVALHPEE